MKQILIITSKKDFHPTSVINLLEKGNIPFFRLNTEVLMVEYEFAWTHDGEKVSFVIKDKSSGKKLNVDDILSVWYRRPLEPEEIPFHVDEQIDKHNKTESKTFFVYLMYYLSNFYSIGNHRYDKYARSKLVQLRLASELGMKIPYTCFSNTKEGVVQLAKLFPEVILKPLRSYNLWYTADKVYSLYATKVCSNKIVNVPEEAFCQTVSFCENYISKQYEVRVTIIGPYVFACKLDSQAQEDDTGKIDWRQGYDFNLKHEMIQLPDEVELFCRKYLRHLSLNFGCFDFIVTPEDEYVFLECNPNGQWGWIEDECHVPMSEAIVDCLLHQLPV